MKRDEIVKLAERAGFCIVDGEVRSPYYDRADLFDEVDKLVKLAIDAMPVQCVSAPAQLLKEVQAVLTANAADQRAMGNGHAADGIDEIARKLDALQEAYPTAHALPDERASQLDEFKHWLNDRRACDVSFVFHEIVAKYSAALAAKPVPDEFEIAVKFKMSVEVYDGLSVATTIAGGSETVYHLAPVDPLTATRRAIRLAAQKAIAAKGEPT